MVNQIHEVLKRKEPYDKLRGLFRDLCLLENPKARELVDRVDKEINFEIMGIEIWNKLNPLLQQASEAMARCGIKPEDFYG